MKRMAQTRLSMLSILGWIALTVIACSPTNMQTAALARPNVWIDAPLNNTQVELAPVNIVSHASDQNSISHIELSVNGAVIRTDANQDATQSLVVMSQPWTPSGSGKYLLQIRARSSTGMWGDYANATINVASVDLPTPTALPTATPTRTPTFTPTPTSLPNITVRFTADDNALTLGECTNLRWTVTNVAQLTLDNAPVDLNGAKRVCPTQATSYRLQMTTLDRQITERIITISVTSPTRTLTRTPTRVITATPTPIVGCSGIPSIGSFSASPTTINAGGTSTLVWSAVTNADAVEIDRGIGGVPAPGSAQVSPNTTTTYTLTARCKGNAVTRQVTVNVNVPVNTGPTIGSPSFSSTQLTYFNSSICTPSRASRVQVTVSVSDAQGVAKVVMFYRYSDGSKSTSFASVSMSQSSGNWTYLLNAPSYPTSPAINTDAGWIQFYFVATDTSGASTTSPAYNNSISLIYCGKP